MREVDTEAPVIWPAWCYSGDLTSETSPQTAASPQSHLATVTALSTSLATASTPYNHTISVTPSLSASQSTSGRNRSRRNNLYTTSLTSPTSSNLSSSSASSHTSLDEKPSLRIFPQNPYHLQHPQHQLTTLLNSKRSTPSPSKRRHSPAATNLSSTEKMLSDRLLFEFVENNNRKHQQHCDNPTASLLYDKIKNEPSQSMDTIMAGLNTIKNGDLSNNNNISSSNNNSSSNNFKRERLSPTGNGDLRSSMSRSRSATPSSYPGTPPNDMVGQNLAANLLSTVQAAANASRSNDFQARNYSDFMRSLAAKYNNCNPNDSSLSHRNLFFDPPKFPSHSSTRPSTSNNTGGRNKDSPPSSPTEPKRQSNVSNHPQSSTQVPSVPFVSSLLSSLQFSPSAVFPPLIDMSSTQALVTLARAAEEAECQKALRDAAASSQQGSSECDNLIPPALRAAAVAAAAQQTVAAQFAQPFLLPSQQFQRRTPSRTFRTRSQSPATSGQHDDQRLALNESVVTASSFPLDLSSTPHLSKRIKMDTSSSSSSPSISPAAIIEAKPSAASPNVGKTSNSSAQNVVRHCQAQSDEVVAWTVDEVCTFVDSIDICKGYVQSFRDQCIDGSGLPLLTEDHLTKQLGMKLGPALKLRSVLAKKLGGPCPCVSCTTLEQQKQTAALATAASVTPTVVESSVTVASCAQPSTSLPIRSSPALVASTEENTMSTTTVNDDSGSSLNQITTAVTTLNSNIPRPNSTDSGS